MGVGGGGGSRYKVTARCVPEVNITSPPPIDGPLHKITSPQEQSSQHQQQQQQQQTSTSFAQQQLQCAKQFFSGRKVNNNYNYNNNTSNTNNKNGNNINNINNNHSSSHNLINGSSNNTSNNTSNGQKPSNKKHHFLLRSKQTNTIFSSGCTLVEEEDFNELTAVPNATIVIATNATTNNHQHHHHHLNTETRVAKSRHLPPLKLTSYAPTTTAVLPSKLTNQTPKEAEAEAEAAAEAEVARLKKQTIVATIKTPTPIGRQSTPPTTITPKLDKEINAVTSKIAAVDVAVEATPINGFLNVSRQSSHETDDNSIAITNTTTTTNTHTITSYSQNSKTTRSWPVIYRNPQYYDYEALFAQATKQLQQQQQQRKKQQQQQQQQQIKVDNYKKKYQQQQQQQQAYTNQFAQSILYSSSNEDLGSFNEDATPATSIGDAGKQTTCYYFTQTSSRHNSIYEQPSASTVVCNGALQTDLQWSSSAEEVQQLRRNSSFLLPRSQNNSYRRHQKRSNGNNNNKHYFNESNGDISHQLGCGVNDDTEKGHNNDKVDDEISPTSMNSAMDGGSNNTNSTACCSSCCMGPPPVLYLFVTLLMTTSATAMLCAAIMTDHWEHVIWDRESLDRYTNRSKLELEWIMEDKVAMLKTDKKDHRLRRDSVFLVPMHGGIWTLCIDLPLHELQELRRLPKFPRSAPPCVNYLANSMENARGEEQRNDWQHSESQTSLQPHLRMQNLSISCSLVCLIILGSAALVGAFGVCQRQISAILITGVMYLLAATFALFTLMIIHFKRQQGRPMLDSDYDGTVDGIVARPGGAIVAKPLLGARIFLTSWSLDLGWGGVVLCAIASMLWIFLSKIMRYNPLTLLLI